jgi:hypothetical protein
MRSIHLVEEDKHHWTNTVGANAFAFGVIAHEDVDCCILLMLEANC